MSDSSDQPKPARYALLAILLPFAGVVIGAFLEHGAGFLCKLGLAECQVSRSVADDLQNLAETLSESHRATQDLLGQCQSTLASVLDDVERAQTQVAGVAPAAMQTLASVETQLRAELTVPDRILLPEAEFRLLNETFPDFRLNVDDLELIAPLPQ